MSLGKIIRVRFRKTAHFFKIYSTKPYVNKKGRTEPWRAFYDQYGRLCARTDYNAGNIKDGIPDVHYHLFEWGPGKNPLKKKEHFPGEFVP